MCLINISQIICFSARIFFQSQLICKAFTSLFFGGWGSLIWFLRILGGVLVLFQYYFNLEKHVFILILFPFITRDTFFWGDFSKGEGNSCSFWEIFGFGKAYFYFLFFVTRVNFGGGEEVLGGYGSFLGDFF